MKKVAASAATNIYTIISDEKEVVDIVKRREVNHNNIDLRLL